MDNINSLQEFLDYIDKLSDSNGFVEDPVKIEVSGEVYDEINNHFKVLLIGGSVRYDPDNYKDVVGDKFILRKRGITFLITKT